MFDSSYKKAYHTITPSQKLISDTIEKMQIEKIQIEKSVASKSSGKNHFALRVSITAAAAVLCLVMAVPVCAAKIPAFYKIVEYLSPALADRLVPIEQSSTSQGITMQVEAIRLEGNEAEIIISLSDAEDSTQDLVHGEMDLFDSYNLSDHTNESIVGGCHFLTYDEAEDKVYFQVNVQSDNVYQSDKLQFSVCSVLCDKVHDTRDVDLSGIVYSAETKRVTLSGSGGSVSKDMLPDFLQNVPGTMEDPRPGTHVLDMMQVTDCAADDFTLTGIAYMDGVLRVQMCMGDNWSSDRHVQLFLVDSDGKERFEDHSVSWNEEVGDTSYQFYEFWFLGHIDNIADYSMYGIFHDSGALIKGDWRVTFRLQ
ncbi:MAG: hypothetical protein K2M91_07020 [Lachnospiraceae bacterium]|nr:hypothetical protein [Lachnospiraceae bacterium]